MLAGGISSVIPLKKSVTYILGKYLESKMWLEKKRVKKLV